MDLPAEPQLRWILRHTARLLQLGAEPVRGLILPTAEFFPDRFDGSPASVGALMMRVQQHAGLADLKTQLTIVTPEGEETSVGGCSSGACGTGGKIELRLDRVAVLDDGSYRVALHAGEVRHPTLLTTALVRAVSFMFLNEADGYDGVPPRDREPLTDLCAVLLGFGVLVANGSYIYMKGCSGVQVHSATQMPVDEITVALALYCKLHEVPERTCSKHLELTPGEHFEEASVWASSNADLVRRLRSNPSAIEDDEFTLSPARSWLARVLGVGKKKRALSPEDEIAALERSLATSLPAASPKKERTMDDAKAKRIAELRALVDESLEG